MFPIGDDNRGARGTPIITLTLLGINVLVFLYQITLSLEALEDFIFTYGMIPAEIERNQDMFTLLTSMFVHGGWAHLIGNMLFLWVFGDNIERRFGSIIFLAFYLLTGLAASIAHIVTNSGSVIPSVGASGAISGVLGAYILLYPTNRVSLLFGLWGIVQVPAYFFLGFWFVTQLINGVAELSVETAQTSGVAFWAHIGGFVAGFVGALVLRFMRPERREPPRLPLRM